MGEPLRCDVHGETHLADVIVTRVQDGSTMTACYPGYVDLCRAIVADWESRLEAAASLEQAEAAAADVAEEVAEAALEEAPEVVARAAAPDPPPPLGVSAVVRRGKSPRRRAYERRRREAARTEAVASTSAEIPSPEVDETELAVDELEAPPDSD